MNSSAINSVNSLRSTVLFVTMKTKLVRTVVKSVTANTTVPSNATSLPISSVVPVVMPVTWLGIVLTDSVVPIGATVDLQLVTQHVQALLQDALVPVMLLTESTRYVKRNLISNFYLTY